MEDKVIVLKNGTTVRDIRLDRLVQYDERSKAYPMRSQLRGLAPKTKTWRGYTTNQGNQGACVGHSVTQEAAARPDPFFGDPESAPADVKVLNGIAREIYFRAQEIDPWAGGEYPGADPFYSGTSVLAGLKAGLERGWWKGYRWALGPGAEAAAQDVILTLSHFGPVVVGTYWYSGMTYPDTAGYLRVEGWPEGGHAYLLTAYDEVKDAVYTPNSWGGYGAGWITRSDLVTLLQNDGEAAMVVYNEILPEPIPAPEPAPVVPAPEPVKEPEAPKTEYEVFGTSKTYHRRSHYPTKEGKVITDTTGFKACKVCKPQYK